MRQFLFLALCFSFSLAAAPKEYGDLLVTEVVSVSDGDTFKANIDDVHPIIGEAIPIRINGIDTPEIRSPNVHIRELAARAKQYLEDALHDAEYIELVNIKRGKYFRIVADVYADGHNIGEMLIDAGLAKPYDGKGPKPIWTGKELHCFSQ